jgi:hypothetical protein
MVDREDCGVWVFWNLGFLNWREGGYGHASGEDSGLVEWFGGVFFGCFETFGLECELGICRLGTRVLLTSDFEVMILLIVRDSLGRG